MNDYLSSKIGGFLTRWLWPFATVILLLMMALQCSSVLQESQTWDEAIYLSSGYTYLTTGNDRLNREQPPLGKLLSALPLVPLHPSIPLGDVSWQKADEVAFGRLFLYRNTVPADAMLFAGRAVTVLITAALGLFLFCWVRRRGGDTAASIALLLFAFDPNILANGRYATNDIAVTFFSFATVVVFDRAFRSQRLAWYAFGGLCLGAALATKYSALYLLAVLVILALWQRPNWIRLLGGAAIATAIGAALMLGLSRGDISLYTDGISATIHHTRGGQLSYLFGMDSTSGWWWYFPAAFFLKSPVGLLVLVGMTLVALSKRVRSEIGDLRVLIVPIVVYSVICLFDRADLGIRYLLPLYPFLFALIAIVVTRYAPAPAVIVCVTLLAAESLAVYPNYLAFFNVLVGGPGSGPHYLLDSNIDWGQDAKRLSWWLKEHGTQDVCASYFGTAPLDYYGIHWVGDPPNESQYRAGKTDCYGAISVNYLYSDAILGSASNHWLRNARPIAKIGYSIYVFDFRKHHEL